MRRVAEILLLGAAVALLMGADNSDARFQKLGDKIMCSCGCEQMLLKCNHVGCTNSATMIGQLHALTGTLGGPGSERYASIQPQSDDEAILNWFRRSWGVTAVVEPGTKGLELWIWILPPAALALGGILVVVALRQWRSRQPARAKAQLDPRLEALRDRARRETEI